MPAAAAGKGQARPEAIKQAAAKPAPPARSLPAYKPQHLPVQVVKPQVYAPSRPSVLSQSLSKATKQNIKTGGQLQQYRATPEGKRAASENERIKTPGLFGTGLFSETRTRQQQKELEKVPRSTGVVVPPTGLAKFLAVGSLVGKGAQAIGPSVGGKSFGSKVYNEAIQTLIGGPRATVEAVQKPGQTFKGFKETLTHPTEHPLQTALIAGGVLKGADVAAGKALKTSTARAPGVVGAEGHQVEVPRAYSQGVVGKGLQRASEKAQEAAGVDPGILRTINVPVFGSKLRKAFIGGQVKPGRVDIHRGAINLTRDMQVAKGSEFVDAHTPSKILKLKGELGKAHNEAVMPYVEGYARRAETYWEDLNKREGQLLAARKGLTDHIALERNQKQIDQLRLIKEHRTSIGEHPEFHEGIAHKLTEAQSHSFHRELLEGHLEPDQYHARLIQFGLEHGELLDRGRLQYEKNPGKDPLIREVGHRRRELTFAKKRTEQARGAKDPARLEEAVAHELDLRHQVEQGDHEIKLRKATGVTDRQGNQWAGLYDEAGERVHGRDLEALYQKETSPRNLQGAMGKVLEHEPARSTAERLVGPEVRVQARGGRAPGFVTHKDTEVPTVKFQSGERPGGVTRSRTGESAMTGNYENHFGVMHREFRKSARNLSGYRSATQLLEQFGVHSDTLKGIKTTKTVNGKTVPTTNAEQQSQMVELARELNETPDKHAQKVQRELGKWVVVSRGPERVLASPNVRDSRYATINQLGRVEGKAAHENPLKYTLIPEKVLQRLDEHVGAENPTNPIERGMKRITGYQRHVALYSTPRWPVGVHQENMIRLAAINTSPLAALTNKLAETSRAYKAGKGWVEGMNKAAGDDLRRIQADSGYSVSEKLMARDHAAMLEHGSLIGSEIRSLMEPGNVSKDMLDKAPDFADGLTGTVGVKQGLAAWESWKHTIGEALTRMENRTRIAAAGHQLIQQYGAFSDEVKGLVAKEDKIVKQVVKGHVDPVEGTRFTEALLDSVGNWSHLTPLIREARQSWTPFGLWWLNSAKFMFKTMPLEHPLKTALWTALVAATKPDERPEFKQGSIHVNLPWLGPIDTSLIHYSPADIGHEAEKTAGQMVLPWFSEAFLRAAGINSLYQSSIYNASEAEGKAPSNVKAAAESAGTSFVPFGSMATSLIRKGGSPNEKGSFPQLEAKPGTEKGIGKTVEKLAFPVPFTYSKEEAKGKGRELKGRKIKGRELKARKIKARKL